MKANLKTSVSLFFGKGNWVERVFMILLASISLAVFTLASMRFTHTQREYLVVDCQNQLKASPYLIFSFEKNGESGISKYRDIIRTEMGDEYFSAISGLDLQPVNFVTANFTEEAGKFYESYASELLTQCIVSGTAEMYGEMGYPLIAGHYPETENETVISKTLFEAFREFGYSDNSRNYSGESGEMPFLQFDMTMECATREEISSYKDIMGKRLAGTNRKRIFEFIITGIYDDSLVKDKVFQHTTAIAGSILFPGYAFMLLSDKFERNYCKDEYDWYDTGPCVSYLFRPVSKPMTRKSYAKKVILLSEKLYGILCDEYGSEIVSPGDIGAYEYYYDHSDLGFLNFVGNAAELRVKTYIAIGAIMFIIAVLLNAFLMSDIMYRKRRQIAMLRALGYKKEKVTKIVMMSVLIMSFMVFFVSLLLTVTIYYCWFKDFVTMMYCTLFIFNIWSVVILFVSSFLLTTLSAIVPILLFFRKPIAENLKRRE